MVGRGVRTRIATCVGYHGAELLQSEKGAMKERGNTSIAALHLRGSVRPGAEKCDGDPITNADGKCPIVLQQGDALDGDLVSELLSLGSIDIGESKVPVRHCQPVKVTKSDQRRVLTNECLIEDTFIEETLGECAG